MSIDAFAGIQAAAEEIRTSAAYFLDNNHRRNETNALVIQRTLSGAAFFRDEKKESLVPAGYAMLFTRREKTSYGYPKAAIEPYRQRFLTISRTTALQAIFTRLRNDFGSVVLLPKDSESEALFNEVFVRYDQRTFRDRFHESELLYRLMVALYREQVQETHTSNPIEYGHHFIRNRFRSPVNLKNVAEKCGISREHFIRQFSLRYGEAPGTMLRRLRLEHADAMLAATEMSVEDVALASGFTSPNSFGRAYRLKFCRSPRSRR